MPYRKEELINEEVYHVILRGLDDSLIFKDNDDYYRGIFSIYEFNNSIPVEIWLRRKKRKKEKELGDPFSQQVKRDLLVDILAFCFMPNHMHLLLKQVSDNGITKFMRKVGAGYGGYFNRKYQRKGYVFQNRFLSVHVRDDNQLKVVFNYINANPISLIEPNFKEMGIHYPGEAIEFVEKYKWSSYQDYLDIKNFPSVTEREFMNNIIGGAIGCKEMLKDWVTYKKELTEFSNLFLE